MPSLYDELMIALHGVWNRRWLALGVAWVVCVLGWLAISFVPNAYESKARVYVATQSVIQDKAGISPLEQQKSVPRPSDPSQCSCTGNPRRSP